MTIRSRLKRLEKFVASRPPRNLEYEAMVAEGNKRLMEHPRGPALLEAVERKFHHWCHDLKITNLLELRQKMMSDPEARDLLAEISELKAGLDLMPPRPPA
jgi:hypothetical protein